jgi:hypothetical protein
VTRQNRTRSERGGVKVAWLVAAALGILALGVVLMITAVTRQPPLVETTQVLPAPTVAIPTMPAGVPGAAPLAMPQGAMVPAVPQQPGAGNLPQSIPPMGAVPAGMPPGGMMPAVPPPTATPRPTPTPPIAATFECQKGLKFEVKPEEAAVTINGEVLGRARMWSGDDELELPGPGHYYVRISSPGRQDYWCKVTVTPSAEKKTKKIEVELKKGED